MKNKKGFTLVELIAVIVILIILMVIAVTMANKQMEKSRIKAFIKEANTFARGAIQKESVDRNENLAADDIFHNTEYGKVCYSISQKILNKYVSKTTNTYHGSVEVCYGIDCTYQTKIWITDGKHYIDGLTDPTDEEQVTDKFTSTEYPESCGIKAIGGGNKGDKETAEFDYTGHEEQMEILLDGVYSLEVWGAQGGDYTVSRLGGAGSYSYAEVELTKGDKLYINVGGKGSGPCTVDDDTCKATFNGGAKGGQFIAAGGGATHIATKSGQLFDVPINDVYIIAGGGGGGNSNENGRDFLKYAGGYTNSFWWNSRESGKFGLYGGYPQSNNNYRGNGGGYSCTIQCSHGYDANSDCVVAGTGYVHNPKTKNSVMYCYNCPSNGIDFATSKTIVNAAMSEKPVATESKLGNGYAKIKYIENFTENN